MTRVAAALILGVCFFSQEISVASAKETLQEWSERTSKQFREDCENIRKHILLMVELSERKTRRLETLYKAIQNTKRKYDTPRKGYRYIYPVKEKR